MLRHIVLREQPQLGVMFDLGKAFLVVGGDAKARDAGGRQAGAVCKLLYTTDLGHGPSLLLFFFGRRRQDLHIMLLL